MNKLLQSDLRGYVERSITDIARKCSVSNTDVLNEIKARYFKETL